MIRSNTHQLAASRGGLARLVERLGEADRITGEWKTKHDAILREVGTAMRAERERCQISLRALAIQLGCSAPFLSDMERGHRKYSIEWCRKAMAILSRNAAHAASPNPRSTNQGCMLMQTNNPANAGSTKPSTNTQKA